MAIIVLRSFSRSAECSKLSRSKKHECNSQGEALSGSLATLKDHERSNEMPTSMSVDAEMPQASSWSVLYTRHQHEKTVADMLSTKGFEVFLPLYESTRRWKDRSKTLSLPLFPCYVFVRGGLSRRLQILTTPGVHMILFHGEQVAMVPEAEISAIRKAVEGPFRVEPHPFLKCGERVRVTRGSMEGVEGVLVRKKNLYRLVLSVEMMAQSVAVEIDAADVEPVTIQGLSDLLPAKQLAGISKLGETLFHRNSQIADSAGAIRL
jgi:transcription antitermination factor NusG